MATDNQTTLVPDPSPGVSAEEVQTSLVDRFLLSGFAVSISIHALLLVLFALIVFQIPQPDERLDATIEYSENETELLDNVADITQLNVDLEKSQLDLATSSQLPDPGGQPNLQFTPTELADRTLPSVAELRNVPELDLTSHLGGRSAASRDALLKMFGGTEQSERAVRLGLKWLAERQREDGSWSFDHRRPGDKHSNHQAGNLRNSRIGATAMALMAFLGAGHVHNETNEYSHVVYKGLQYLTAQGVDVREGVDFRGRTGKNKDQVPGGNHVMYEHALAAIALSEAFGMTRDHRLREYAQGAIEFIIRTRNRGVGGWRYEPEQAGDLSVSGWMIMALKSGQTAGLRFSQVGFKNAEQFLDACQTDRGAQYAYVPKQGAKHSTTSIGLLCRMYLGWGSEHPALRKGATILNDHGPSRSNIYYNYYATQVMHHLGGSLWPKWNETMRDWLVETQVRSGAEKGSWNVTDPHGNRGGRLYQTCLSIMTLEVYYRHLPLYQVKAVTNE